MSKLPTVSGHQAISAFMKAGFSVARISASHHIMIRAGHPFVLTVPVHSNRDLKPGTLRGLIRKSGLTVEQFTANCNSIRHFAFSIPFSSSPRE
jgi:predicted RNA binding protein YcfA (HicA-like mRNA interferase family)